MCATRIGKLRAMRLRFVVGASTPVAALLFNLAYGEVGQLPTLLKICS